MIGAGNVATHISRHFHSAGHAITCVYSRTGDSAHQLAGELGVTGTADPSGVPSRADFFIVAVPDKSVPDVVHQFRDREGIWLHTAGARAMDLFKELHPRYGVMYPLQTLSKHRPISFSKSPILVEGSSGDVTRTIKALATCLSEHIYEVDTDARLVIHLAAVFANNFTNHMVHLSELILREEKIDISLMMPILRETFSKLEDMGAADAQTGPALRGDKETMQKHLELLKEHPEWEKLYTFISQDISRSRNQ